MKITESQLREIINESIKEIFVDNMQNSSSKVNIADEVKNFNNIVYARQNLNESSINRMLSWLKDCDCVFVSAFRKELKDIKNDSKTYFGRNHEWQEGHRFTHKENRIKNDMLSAELMILGYGISKCKGVYPEGMNKETSEESYFVVNIHNDSNFLDNLLRLGEYYNQDSIYYKKAGSNKGYLIGTNACGYPEYHQKGEESILKVGYASNYMSRIGNNPFSFVSDSSKKFANKQDVINDIAKSKNTDDEYTQRYWQDNVGTSFKQRKQQRIDNMGTNESIVIISDRMNIIEDIHPLTRKCMCEFLKKQKRTILHA